MVKKYLKKIINKFLSTFLSKKFNGYIKNDLIILLYHSISNKPSVFHDKHKLNVTEENFREQIMFFKKYYNVISPLDLLNGNYKKPAVLFSFDDGIENYFSNALPIMEEFNVPSIHFLNMAPINGEFFFAGLCEFLYDRKILNKNSLFSKNEDVKDYLKDKKLLNDVKKYHGDFVTINKLKNFENNPLVFFGNHMYNHYNLTTLNREEIELNINLNDLKLKKFRNYLPFFAYPFGVKDICYNNYTDNILIEKNFKKIFYADSLSFNSEDGIFLNRKPITNDLNTEKNLKNSILFNKLRNSIKVI